MDFIDDEDLPYDPVFHEQLKSTLAAFKNPPADSQKDTKYLKLLRRYLEAENSTSPEGKVGGTTIKAQLAPRMMPWTDMRGSDKTLAENLNLLEYIHRAFSKSSHKVDR